MKCVRPVEITADEIGEALHAAKLNETFELPARIKRSGRWRAALVLFEAEDREEARHHLALFEPLRDPKTAQFDARRLRKSSPGNA